MPRMKKSLQPKKKTEDQHKYAIAPGMFLNPDDRINRGHYWDSESVNRNAHCHFPSYYYGHLTGILTPETYQRCHRATKIGSLYIHVESALCKSYVKDYIKQGNLRLSWEKYYESILAEQVNLSTLAMIIEARKFGLKIVMVSTTPERYKYPVLGFLDRHNIVPDLTVFKPNFRTKDLHFLESTFWSLTDRSSSGQSYFLFNSNLYPNTGWTPISDLF